MRGYHQHCGLAKALDVIGDRWTLLIVRELLIHGGCRYTDLRHGLPDIATNLLAGRLRELQEAGVVCREEAPPPIATTLFRLTERGRELESALLQLGRWGAPLLGKPSRKDSFRAHWLCLPLKFHIHDRTPWGPPIAIELRAGGQKITVESDDGSLRIRMGAARDPDAVVTGDPTVILELMAGRLNLARARAAGLKYEGDAAILRRVVKSATSAT